MAGTCIRISGAVARTYATAPQYAELVLQIAAQPNVVSSIKQVLLPRRSVGQSVCDEPGVVLTRGFEGVVVGKFIIECDAQTGIGQRLDQPSLADPGAGDSIRRVALH